MLVKNMLEPIRVQEGLSRVELGLLAAGILFLPYDGMPILPMTYRPLTLFPLCVAGLVHIVRIRKHISEVIRSHKILLALCFVAVFYTTIQSVLIGELFRLSRFMTTATLGVFSYITFYELFHEMRLKYSKDQIISWLFGLIALGYLPSLCFGIVELLSIEGIISAEINTILMQIFGGWQPDRIYITSREASWASIHMLIAAFSYFYLLLNEKKLRWILPLLISMVLFLFTKSMQGVLVLVCGFLMWMAWYCIRSRSLKKSIIIITGFIGICIVGYCLLYAVMSLQPGYYYAQRFLGLKDFGSLIELIHTDQSTFTRLMSPVIGIWMMLEHLPFGVGGCMYSYYYSDFICAHMPWALSLPEVSSFASGITEASPFCLYSRLACEFGIIGICFVIGLFINYYSGTMKLPSTKKGMLTAAFAFVVLAFPLQFDSYYCMPLLLVAALVISFVQDDHSR